MSVQDYFGQKTKAEISRLPGEIVRRTRLWIQTNPEYAALAGIGVGIVLVFYLRAIISLAILLACVYGVMYFMAKDSPNP